MRSWILKAYVFSALTYATSAFLLLACDDPGDPATPQATSSSSSSSSSGSSTSGSSGSTTSGSTSSGEAPKGMPADCANGDEGAAPPVTSAELNAWLQKKTYQCWARESQVHASTGPHGGNVRVYLNKTLVSSLGGGGGGAAENAEGSVAVKEFFGSGKETVTGWAVGVKTQAASANGQGWYWYEVFNAAPNAPAASAGQGTSLCSNCHRGGKDYVLIPFPLR
jgi:hypothetical protein